MPETREQRANRRIDEVLGDLLAGHAPRHKLTKAEAQALIGDFYLNTGGGTLVSTAGRAQVKMCVMQVANVYNAALSGETVQGGLIPAYSEVDQVDPVIETYLIALNDAAADDARQALLAYVPKLLNTRVSDKTERRAALVNKLAGEYAWEEWKKFGRDFFGITDDGEGGKSLTKTAFAKEAHDMVEGAGNLAEMVVELRGVEEATKVLDRLLRAR